MKTTADVLSETTKKYFIFYEDEKVDVSKTINGILSAFFAGQMHKFISTAHTFSFYKDTKLINASIKIVYESGTITMYVVPLSIGCEECEGRGTIHGECECCGQETDVECEECCGSGFYSRLDDAEYYDGFKIQKEILIKTIDLNQGELDFTKTA